MNRIVPLHKQVAEKRFREQYGLYYEDFEVGDIFEHRPGRTITEYDMIASTLLTMNTHPLHFDVEYAKHSEFGKPLVPSPLTLSIVVGMTVTSTSQKAVANLGFDEVRFSAPVFVGDTLYAETEVLDKRESKSRPNQGLVSVITRGYKVDAQSAGKQAEIMSFKRTFLMPKTGHAVDDHANY